MSTHFSTGIKKRVISPLRTVSGLPSLTKLSNIGTTLPVEPKTFPYLVQIIAVGVSFA